MKMKLKDCIKKFKAATTKAGRDRIAVLTVQRPKGGYFIVNSEMGKAEEVVISLLEDEYAAVYAKVCLEEDYDFDGFLKSQLKKEVDADIEYAPSRLSAAFLWDETYGLDAGMEGFEFESFDELEALNPEIVKHVKSIVIADADNSDGSIEEVRFYTEEAGIKEKLLSF